MTKTDLMIKVLDLSKNKTTISTAQAARMLGVSTTLLQKLVDQEAFQAWKTPGGHRRIDLDSVKAYQNQLKNKKISIDAKQDLPIIYIVSNNNDLKDSLADEMVDFKNDLEVIVSDSLAEALLSFSIKIPQVLILKLSMPLDQELSTITALDKFISQVNKKIKVIYMTERIDELSKIKVNNKIHLMDGKLNSIWLGAFVLGVCVANKI